MDNFGFYLVITDPIVGYEKCCEDAVKAGVKVVQLRCKVGIKSGFDFSHVEVERCRKELLEHAKNFRSITKGTDTIFIVDDDAALAAEVGADGVHVGQSDMSVAEVRKLYPNLLIGLSTHSIEQAKLAIPQEPDYIGTGPVWATPTKQIADPTLGVENAAIIHKMVPFPATAIGGINKANLPQVLKAGIKNYCVVRAVCGAKSPYDAIRELQDVESSCL